MTFIEIFIAITNSEELGRLSMLSLRFMLEKGLILLALDIT